MRRVEFCKQIKIWKVSAREQQEQKLWLCSSVAITTLMTQALQSAALPKILCGQNLHVSNNNNKYSEDDKLVKRTDSSLKNANMF